MSSRMIPLTWKHAITDLRKLNEILRSELDYNEATIREFEKEDAAGSNIPARMMIQMNGIHQLAVQPGVDEMIASNKNKTANVRVAIGLDKEKVASGW